MERISVVITTHNRYSDLISCLNSVVSSSYRPLEVIIVDDCSIDETRHLDETSLNAILQGDLTSVKIIVIHNKENWKMIHSRNIGAKTASANYIVFIDDDNIVDVNMIKELYLCAVNNPRYGVIGPKSYYHATDNIIWWYVQKINLFTGRTTYVYNGNKDKGERLYDVISETDGVPNLFMIPKRVFEKCGYFDESLIQTFTEPDFSFNARRYGFSSVVCPSAITYHNCGGPSNGPDRVMGNIQAKAYCLIRNRFVIVKRYAAPYKRPIFIFMFSWVWLMLYITSAVKIKRYDRIKYYLLGYVDGLYYFVKDKFRKVHFK
ncbi:MAG: glycosyltransferase family 2 protein [Nitrospirae bacterium]|nr:glycosyltransferase family 2 protein [Nitrospirota bacterium]